MTLLGLVLLGFARGTYADGGLPQAADPDSSSMEPTSAPSNGSSGEELESRPGREDPEQFYKKPPRKPKQRNHLHA